MVVTRFLQYLKIRLQLFSPSPTFHITIFFSHCHHTMDQSQAIFGSASVNSSRPHHVFVQRANAHPSGTGLDHPFEFPQRNAHLAGIGCVTPISMNFYSMLMHLFLQQCITPPPFRNDFHTHQYTIQIQTIPIRMNFHGAQLHFLLHKFTIRLALV